MSKWGQILDQPFNMGGDTEYNFRTLKPEYGWPNIGQGGGQVNEFVLVPADGLNYAGYNSPDGSLTPDTIEGIIIDILAVNKNTDIFVMQLAASAQIPDVDYVQIEIDGYANVLNLPWNGVDAYAHPHASPELKQHLIDNVGNSLNVTIIEPEVFPAIVIRLAAGETDFQFESNVPFLVDGVPMEAGNHVITGKTPGTDIVISRNPNVTLFVIPTIRFWSTYDTIEIIVINTFGTVESLANSFANLKKLTSFLCTTDENNVVSLSETFSGCSGLTSFPMMYTGKVTSFNRAWNGCNKLTSFPLLNTSSGTNFVRAWYLCNALTSFPLIDTSEAINLGEAWRSCSGLTSFPLINTAKCTNISKSWIGCSSLTEFPLINTSNVTNWYYVFANCSGLTSFPLLDTSKATNISLTFNGCSSLTSFPPLDFSSVNDVRQLWQNCSSLTSLPEFDFSKVTDFVSMLSGCTSLECIAGTIDTRLGVEFNNMFNNCPSLASPDATAQADLTKEGGGIWTNPGDCPSSLWGTHVMEVGNSGAIYGYFASNAGVLTPDSFDGEGISSLGSESGFDRFWLLLLSGGQIGVATIVYCEIEGYAGVQQLNWNGGFSRYLVDSADVALTAYLQGQVGNDIGIKLRLTP